MIRLRDRSVALLMAALMLGCVSAAWSQQEQHSSLQELKQAFVSPPDSARIMMRWWWFGPAVTKPEIEREIRKMKEGGIGGFEIQPVYPVELDDAGKGFRNLTYLSDEFLDAVRFANQTGKREGMRVDITLGSGWPFGGPHIPVTQAASRLRLVKAAVPHGTDSVQLPSIANGESLIAGFAAPGTPEHFDTARAEQIVLPQPNEFRLKLKADAVQDRVALFFVSSRTGQLVKRPALGAEGFVLDHLDKSAVENHLNTVGSRLMLAFGDQPPYAVFSDSLEVYGADWTPDLLQQFRARRGYDLLPHLPALFTGAGPDAASIRHDWGETLTELVNERYLKTVTAWAAEHHTRFRSQTYGFPGVMLSSNELVDLPEGEGTQWRRFTTTRWATSGSHLYARNVSSAETWTWLHSPAFRATPLDMKAEADLMFLQGVNQIVGHGWPYSPPSAGEPGWSLYAAGALNDHNPWWPVMPELSRYMQRMSYMLRQGEPVNDVAVYLPTDDAWAGFVPGRASITEQMKQLISPAMTEQILDAGFNFDFIDAPAIGSRGIHYPVLILPRVDRIPLSTYRKIKEYAKRGGKVIALATAPAHAAGLAEKGDSPQIQQISEELFHGTSVIGKIAESEADLGKLLAGEYTPDMRTETRVPQLGFAHRRLPFADVYFVANTSNEAVRTTATFRSPYTYSEWWDPMTGSISPAGSERLEIALAPYESRMLVMDGRKGAASASTRPQTDGTVLADLSHDWKVTFPAINYSEQMPSLQSWTENPDTRFYSGEAIYEKDFDLDRKALAPGAAMVVDFGEGKRVEAIRDPNKPGTQALIQSPLREAAIIFVNGTAAGNVWHPPYQLDVSSLVHAGKNHIEIRVTNLAINTEAGRATRDYRLLNSRYGERFQQQDIENLTPLPAGILGPVTLKSWGRK